MERFQMRIGGKEHLHHSEKWFDTFNPYTGEPWAQIAQGQASDVDVAVQAADAAFRSGPWNSLTPSQRGLLLHRVGDLIARDASRLAKLEVQDNGKLIAEMAGQLNYVPQWYYYFGGLADKIQGAALPLDKKGYFNYTKHEPLGVVGVITPWNSPLLILSWKLAPALAAGCTVVIKPSEFASASTIEFVKLFDEAGFPPGVVNVVTGFGKEVGSALVEHPLVRKITFTGSDETGRHIGAQAGRQFKRASLELGGKSPNIVFEDANLDDALNGAVSAILAATGQTCIAGSRLLLQRSIHDQFVTRLIDVAKTAKMGDPQLPTTQVGPVTTLPQLEKILSYIEIAKADGAKLVLGGGRASRPECGNGWFVEPTVFSGVDPNMRIAQEEVFGPVLSVIPFDTEEEAVSIANNTRFGLGAGVWTRDFGRAIRMADSIQSGTVWINTYRAVSFMSPFGGYKDSGVGRENGVHAMDEYLQVKSVWINSGALTTNPFVMR